MLCVCLPVCSDYLQQHLLCFCGCTCPHDFGVEVLVWNIFFHIQYVINKNYSLHSSRYEDALTGLLVYRSIMQSGPPNRLGLGLRAPLPSYGQGPSMQALAQQQQQQMHTQTFVPPQAQKMVNLFIGSISGGITDAFLNELLSVRVFTYYFLLFLLCFLYGECENERRVGWVGG